VNKKGERFYMIVWIKKVKDFTWLWIKKVKDFTWLCEKKGWTILQEGGLYVECQMLANGQFNI